MHSEPTEHDQSPVIDRQVEWRRSHTGVYVLPCLTILLSVFALTTFPVLSPILGILVGLVALVLHHRAGKVERTGRFLLLELAAVGLSFAGLGLHGLIN